MKKLTAILLVLCLLLSACTAQREETAASSSPQETSETAEVITTTVPTESPEESTLVPTSEEPEPTQTAAPTEPVPEETHNPTGEEPALIMESKIYPDFEELTKDGTPLSDEELAEWNKYFKESPDAHYFLETDYETPEEISLFFLLRDNTPVTDEEKDLLKEKYEFWRDLFATVDWESCYKVERSRIEEILQTYLCLSLEETGKSGFDRFYYLEETDAYYYSLAGNTYNPFVITRGAVLEDGSVLLE